LPDRAGLGRRPARQEFLADTTNPDYRQILQQYTLYNRALSTNLHFPKTRKIVFLNNRPATLPGWAELAVG
jgi:CRISPR-associated protein Csm5